MKIKKGDTVLIISGKYRGKKGKVLRTFPRQGLILVEGVNMVKKHLRARRAGQKGQIIQLPKPIFSSKAKLYCPKCKKTTRIGYKLEEKNKKRVCKKCGQEI